MIKPRSVHMNHPLHEPDFPIINGLRAGAPHPEIGHSLDTFGQFIGTWDVQAEYIDQSGNRTYHGNWEWSFAWILGGRAIQDVIVDLGTNGNERRTPLGTTLRYLHADTGDWTVYWLGVFSGINVRLSGGVVDDQIVLEGPDPDGTLNRWIFSDITPGSFSWTGLESQDNVKWWPGQRMKAVRRDSAERC
jgi:hypothetical protein